MRTSGGGDPRCSSFCGAQRCLARTIPGSAARSAAPRSHSAGSHNIVTGRISKLANGRKNCFGRQGPCHAPLGAPPWLLRMRSWYASSEPHNFSVFLNKKCGPSSDFASSLYYWVFLLQGAEIDKIRMRGMLMLAICALFFALKLCKPKILNHFTRASLRARGGTINNYQLRCHVVQILCSDWLCSWIAAKT